MESLGYTLNPKPLNPKPLKPKRGRMKTITTYRERRSAESLLGLIGFRGLGFRGLGIQGFRGLGFRVLGVQGFRGSGV